MASRQGRRSRRGPTRAGLVVLIVLLALAVFVYRTRRGAPRPAPRPPGIVALPEMKEKPQALEITFKGCAPEGAGGDPELNRLKNRVDEGNYAPVAFNAIAQLPWPWSVEKRPRRAWSEHDVDDVGRYEGIPVSIEGYLAGARESGPEACNCHAAEPDERDYHIWLTADAHQDRSGSIVVEATPRVRVRHPNWRTDVLSRIAKEAERVRINGWLMLDPEHPEEVGKTRGTLWEVHPIMKIEVQQDGAWVTL